MLITNILMLFTIDGSKHSIMLQLDEFKKSEEQEVQEAIAATELSYREVESQIVSVVSSLDQSFHEFQEIIDQHKQELLKEASQIKEEKLKRLSQQKEQLEQRMAEILQKVAEEKGMIESGTREDLVAAQHKVSSWINGESRKHFNYDPVEEADVEVYTDDCHQEMRLVCKRIKIVKKLVDPEKCTIDGLNMQTVEVLKPFAVKLHTFTASGKPQKIPVDVEAKLTSLVNLSQIRATVEREQENSYQITCTPQNRGRHLLNITVDGQNVAGSPLQVLVKIPPTQFGKPVRIIEGLRGPTGMAFNSAGELVVAELNGGVAILDRNGRKVRSIERHGKNHDFEQPWGIAVDEDDNIYVTDEDNHKIYKFNKHLELVSRNTVSRHKCYGIAVVGDRVMVIERRAKVLNVYTKDLTFLKVIDIGISGCSLTVDKDLKLYICDPLCHQIQVLSDKGKQLFTIGSNKPELGLQIPHFVCVDDNLLYVTEYDGNCVSVFSIKDKMFVTSFGSIGSAAGQFDHPYGIVFDADGFLYVSGRVNNRIQVF